VEDASYINSTYQETHPSVLCGINDEADGREHDAPNKTEKLIYTYLICSDGGRDVSGGAPETESNP